MNSSIPGTDKITVYKQRIFKLLSTHDVVQFRLKMLKYLVFLVLVLEVVNSCKPEWDNSCEKNEDCCTGLQCDKQPEWKQGVCKKIKTTPKPGTCLAEWKNTCTKDQDCCSGLFCERNPNWEYGVCKKRTDVQCLPEWNNTCVQDSHCCSGLYCDRPENWEQGVCKKEMECTRLNKVGCDKRSCCGDSQCYHGPYSNWKLGICFEKTRIDKITKSVLSNKADGEDPADDLADYKQFVRENLVKLHNNELISSKLKCRELDPSGQFYWSINDTYSFRVCDVCKEFPYTKLSKIIIDDTPSYKQQINNFQDCFDMCTSNSSCVAYSYDQFETLCYIFNEITGNFSEDEDTTSVIINQPVGILRDYIYSRNTRPNCEGITPSWTGKVSGIMDCFEQSETRQGYLAVYHEGTCQVYNKDKNCTDITYAHGYVTLLYQDYFQDGNNDWRFTKLDDKDLVVGGQVNATKREKPNKLTQELDPNLKKQIKEQDFENHLEKCFDQCTKTRLCTGVYFKENMCEIVDWDQAKNNEHKLSLGDDGYSEFALNSPIRSSSIYDFTLTRQIGLSEVVYNQKQSNINLGDCLDRCKSNEHCLEVYYNLNRKECLTTNEITGQSRERIDQNQQINWITFRKSRPRFTKQMFGYTLLGKHQVFNNQYDQYLLKTETIDNTKIDKSPMEICAAKCSELGDCEIVEIIRSDKSTQCKIYKDFEFDENVKTSTNQLGDILVKVIDERNITMEYLDQMETFSEDDALNCQRDEFSVELDKIYFSAAEGYEITTSRSLSRQKRGIKDFFKNIGKGIANTFKKGFDTVVGLGKSAVKAIKGDTKGAKKELENLPIVKDGKELVKDFKQIGQGFKEGNLGKIGKGLLGVVTNDITGFIPGGKVAQLGLKGIKGGLKNVGKAAGKSAGKKEGKKDVKDKIGDKNTKKNDKKDDKDKDKKKKCEKKGNRSKRATNTNNNNNCDDNEDDLKKCPKPKIQNAIAKVLDECLKDKPECKRLGGRKRCQKKCNYLCAPGNDEKPDTISCEKQGSLAKWNQGKCEPSDCGSGNLRVIHVKSKGALYKTVSQDIILYSVLYEKDKLLTHWSVAYMQFGNLNIKTDSRGGSFYQHPCADLKGKQLSNGHFKGNGIYDRGHLTPADIFRFNEKAIRSSNLYINVAPQVANFNQGPWRGLELRVQCASRANIKAIVATGTYGDSGRRLRGAVVPDYFWKMVCYKDLGQTHVALFTGKNDQSTTTAHTHVARDQEELYQANPAYRNPVYNPWTAAGQIALSSKGSFGAKFPNPVDCALAQTLDNTQKQKWKTTMGLSRRRRDTADTGSFCSKKDLEEFLKWKDAILPDTNSDDDFDDDDDSDELGSVNIPSKSCGKRIVGYYPSWGETKVKSKTLARFTHIIYAFFEMQSDGRVLLGNPDYSTSSDHNKVRQLAEKRLKRLLAQRDNIGGDIKVSFAVGGWENSQYFSRMSASSGSRVTFIASIVKILEEYSMDGIDIDWEYPVTGGATEGTIEDKKNYVTLLQELRTTLDNLGSKNNRKYFLTFASAAGETALTAGYDLPALLKYADWVNVMTYDFFGPWTSKWGAYTGPPAPLYHGVPKGYSGKFNVNWAIKQYACKLKSAKQVVMGVPLYGRYWFNVPEKTGPHAMYRMAGFVGGKVQGGFASWRDIKKNWLNDPGFKFHYDDVVKSSYGYNPNGTYIGYESEQAIKAKIQFAIEKNLGGLMVWAIDQDDDDLTMINPIAQANLCTNSDQVNFKCIPIEGKRWWTLEDSDKMAGLCGRSAPLYQGYFPVCDPDDLGYSCCGSYGYCGSGDEYCKCPTCVDFADDPNKIIEEPTKPRGGKVKWHLINAPDGERGRCGKDVPKVDGQVAECNPDDPNAYCCSKAGYCGRGKDFCECDGCKDFRKT